MKSKYLILGNGYLGNKFHNFFKDSILSERKIIDLTSILSEIEKYSPEIVINCIGKTGFPNIDWCETHKSETIFSNVFVPLLIAEACQKTNKRMVHIGSGCIYNGDNDGMGFSEEDTPNYEGSFYSKTKLISEKLLKDFENILQVRIRMPIDSEPAQRNLITKLLKFDKIISIKNSISVIDDALKITEKLINLNQKGIFNVVNKGPVTHKEILDLFQEISGKSLSYKLMSIDDLHKITIARRSNCVLSVKKLENLGIQVPNTIDSLRACMEKYIRTEGGSGK